MLQIYQLIQFMAYFDNVCCVLVRRLVGYVFNLFGGRAFLLWGLLYADLYGWCVLIVLIIAYLVLLEVIISSSGSVIYYLLVWIN